MNKEKSIINKYINIYNFYMDIINFNSCRSLKIENNNNFFSTIKGNIRL